MSDDRLKMIETMLEQNPEDDFLVYAAALEYKKRQLPEKATTLLAGIVQRNPQYLAAYYQLGKLQESAGQVQEAIATYQTGKGIAQQQNDTKALQELSEAILMLED